MQVDLLGANFKTDLAKNMEGQGMVTASDSPINGVLGESLGMEIMHDPFPGFNSIPPKCSVPSDNTKYGTMWDLDWKQSTEFDEMLRQIQDQIEGMATEVLPPGVHLDHLVVESPKVMPRRSTWLDSFGDETDADSDVEVAVEGVAAAFGIHPKQIQNLLTSIPRDTLRWTAECAKAEKPRETKRSATDEDVLASVSFSKRSRQSRSASSSSTELSQSDNERPTTIDSDWGNKPTHRRIARSCQKYRRSCKSIPTNLRSGLSTSFTATSNTTSAGPKNTFDEHPTSQPWPGRVKQRTPAPSVMEASGPGDTLDGEPAIKGVYFDRARKLWRANWKENGRVRTKGFSVAEYGNDQARELACEHRLRMELQHSKWNSSPTTSDTAVCYSSASAFPTSVDAPSMGFSHTPAPLVIARSSESSMTSSASSPSPLTIPTSQQLQIDRSQSLAPDQGHSAATVVTKTQQPLSQRDLPTHLLPDRLNTSISGGSKLRSPTHTIVKTACTVSTLATPYSTMVPATGTGAIAKAHPISSVSRPICNNNQGHSTSPWTVSHNGEYAACGNSYNWVSSLATAEPHMFTSRLKPNAFADCGQGNVRISFSTPVAPAISRMAITGAMPDLPLQLEQRPTSS